MPGFSTITGDESIMFADNCSFDGTKRGGKLTTNGQLFIGSTASPHVKNGSITSPNSTLSVGYSSPNITLDVNRSAIPCFFAYVGSDQSNVTGDGTLYNIIFDTTTVNQGTNYNTGTGIFTAPVTGTYQFSVNIAYSNITAANTQESSIFTITSLGSLFFQLNPGAVFTTGGQFVRSFPIVVHMTSGQTAQVQTALYGSTKTIGLKNTWTNFSGFLIA